jgi:beta-mannosidase
MSEFGFQALPPLRTIQTYADEREWNMTSYIMEQHQKNANGNSFIVRQMLDTFRLPKDFSSLVYLSMVLQAEGIRYGVEHWRRHPDRVAGILYWQLNDCWPVASWSSLDYFGRWKALHYAARNFYAPLLLSIEDQPPVQTVFLSNDTLDSWEGKLNWSLETFDGTVVQSGEIEVQVGPQCAKRLLSVDFTGILTDENRRKLVFIAELRHDREIIASQTAFFAPIKHLQLEKPAIKSNIKVEGDQIIIDLYSQSLAVLVEVSFSNTEGVFSDNYFNLPAGKYKQISFPSPAGWTLNNAEKEILVRSIYDTY